MTSYDPQIGQVHLPPSATPYAKAHEEAHRQQHQRRTPAWRFQELTGHLPYCCRLARLLVEIEAARMALHHLRKNGQQSPSARQQAARGLLSYSRALFGW